MNKHTLSVAITFLFCTPISGGIPDGIYHKGWIDFNKNGKMDLYENPKAPLEDRVQDVLSQMTLEEKTCQMATLYGSGRVLKRCVASKQLENRSMERRNRKHR